MTDRKLIDWCLTFPDQAAAEIERAEAALADRTDQLQEAEAALAASEAKVEKMQEMLLWIETYDPVTIATAESKFGFDVRALASTAPTEDEPDRPVPFSPYDVNPGGQYQP